MRNVCSTTQAILFGLFIASGLLLGAPSNALGMQTDGPSESQRLTNQPPDDETQDDRSIILLLNDEVRQRLTPPSRPVRREAPILKPILVEDLDAIASAMAFDEQWPESWNGPYMSYLRDMLVLTDRHLKPIFEHPYSLPPSRGPAPGAAEQTTMAEDRQSLCDTFNSAVESHDRVFLHAIAQTYPEDVRERVRLWLEMLRMRQVYTARGKGRLMLPGASVDLIMGLDHCGIEWSMRSSLGPIMQDYLTEYAPLLKRFHQERAEASAKLRQLRVEPQPVNDDPFAAQRRALSSAVSIERSMASVNTRSLERIVNELSPEEAETLDAYFKERSFPELYPSEYDRWAQQSVQEWLTDESIDGDARELIRALKVEYDQWYQSHARRMERHVREWRVEFAATHSVVLAEKDAYERELRDLLEQHKRKVQQFLRNCIDLFDPERLIEPQR